MLYKCFTNMFIKQNTIYILKHFHRQFHQQFNFNHFTDVHINVPYNIIIKPYINPISDRLVAKLNGPNEGNKEISAKQIGDVIEVKAVDDNKEFKQNKLFCELEIPVRANLKVVTQGDIDIGFFNNSYLILSTERNILLSGYQGKKLSICSENGNVEVGDVIVADIRISITKNGNIDMKKIQANICLLLTKSGSINIGAGYCNDTKLKTECGDMFLGNMHRNIALKIGKGNLIMTGLDGNLDANIDEGNANLHISRIRENGKINLGNGNLDLKLSSGIQENTQINIEAKNSFIDDSSESKLRFTSTVNNNILSLQPENTNDSKKFSVKCNGNVNIRPASMLDLIMKKQIKT